MSDKINSESVAAESSAAAPQPPSRPAKFSLRFTRPDVYDIQFTGDTAAESIDLAISYLQLLKQAYHPEG